MRHTIKTTISLAAFSILMACSGQQSVDDYIAKAKTHALEGNSQAEVIELKNAIKVAPQNAEARYLLGLSYLSIGRAAGAVKELEKARQYNYSSEKLIPLLAQAYILHEENDKVAVLKPESENTSVLAQTEYLAHLTHASLKLNKADDAKKALSNAILLDKNSVYTVLSKAYVAFADGDLAQANTGVKSVLKSQPENINAILLSGQLALAEENYVLASEQFSLYSKLQPASILVHIYLADSYLKQSKHLEAEAEADILLKLNPNHGFANYVKAITQYEQNSYQSALDAAEKALAAKPTDVTLKIIAGASAFQLANFQQSYTYLSDLKSILPPEHHARRILAVSELKLGLIDDLSSTLENLDAKGEQGAKVLSGLSAELLALGKVEEAKELSERAERAAPEDPMQKARTGVLKIMTNDLSGIEDLEKAVEINPEFKQAELAIALAEFKKGNQQKAVALSKKWQEKYPEDIEGYNFISLLELQKGNSEQARTYIDKSLQIKPENFVALLYKAQSFLLDKNADEALVWVTKAVTLHPENVSVLKFYYGLDNVNGAAKIEAALAKKPDDLYLKLLNAQVLYTQKKFNQIIIALSDITPDFKTSRVYWRLLVESYKKQQLNEKAVETLKKWVNISQYGMEAVTSLLKFYESSNQVKQALTLVSTAKARFPDNPAYQLIYTQLLINDQRIDEAKLSLQKIEVTERNADVIDGLIGQMAFADKQYKKAIPLLSKYYNKIPSSRNLALLSAAHKGDGNITKAVEILESHLLKSDKDLFAQQLLASYYLELDSNKAIATYEKLNAASDEKNVIALNNLAYLFLERGDTSKALSYSTKAFELAPKVAHVADTYGMTLLRIGEKRKALKVMRELQNLPGNKDIEMQLNFVEVLLANGRKNQAKDVFEKIKTETHSDNERLKSLAVQLQ